jgi:hypothetical protein
MFSFTPACKPLNVDGFEQKKQGLQKTTFSNEVC